MRIKKRFLQKVVSVSASILLLLNSFTPYLFLAPILNSVKAETETVTPTEEPTLVPTETATPVPTVEISPTVEVTPVETITPTEAPSVPSPPAEITTPTPTEAPNLLSKEGTVTTDIVESYSCRADSLNGCLATDKADYAPTDVAIITGHGFLATIIYTIRISSTDEPAVNYEDVVTTDENGSFTVSYQLDGNYRPNYLVELRGGSGQVVVSVTFTDSEPNIPPSFDPIPDQVVDEDTSSQDVMITNVSQGSGESGQTVTMSTTSSDPTVVPNPSVSGSGATRTLTYMPTPNSYGSTIITVTADDGQSQNNTYFMMFTITVNQNQDTTSPVVEAHGDEIVEATDSLGAIVTYDNPTTSDDFDPPGTATCLPISGSSFAFGDTTVTCDATDSAGNSAISTYFMVTVQDTNPPVITVLGDNPVTVEIKSPYSDVGAIAIDNIDGDVTSNLTYNGSNVDTSQVDSYTVYFDVNDSSGNGAVQQTRTVNVIDSIADAFAIISANLAAPGSDIANNLNTVNANNVSNFPGLYFEKSIDGMPVGKLSFTEPLDLTDSLTQDFLRDLGTYLDQSEGRIAFDVGTANAFAEKGAILKMYNIPFVTETNLVIRDDNGNILGEDEGIVSNFSYDPNIDDPAMGTVTFTAAHFTQFDIDTTPPTFGPSPSDSTGTTGETAVVRVTAIDDVAVDKAQISVNGGDLVDMTFVNSLDLKKRYTYDITVPSDSTTEITYLVKIFDVAGNSATSTSKTISVTDNDAPTTPSITTPVQTVNTNTIHIIGTAEADSDVSITGGASTAAGTATGGNYDITVTLTQNEVNNLSVTATDAASNQSSAATVDITHDNTPPTVEKWGDNTEDVTIDAADTANLTFSEPLNSTSRSAVQAALTVGADHTITYVWNGANNALTVTGNAASTSTFANDVVVSVTDLVGNTVNSLLIVDSSLTASQTTPDRDGEATADSDSPEVVITDPEDEVTVTVDGDIEATIDVSSFINDDGDGDIPKITINSDDAEVDIPTTKVTGPSGWNGIIAAPTVTTVTLPDISGETLTTSAAIEIGYSSDKLSFDNAVRILLPGQAGKRAGYSRPGTAFTEITSICSSDSQAAGDALGADGECKIDVGLDLVIWTKHFTKFVAYTQTTNSTSTSSSSSSSNSGGGTSNPNAPVCSDTNPGSAPILSAIAGVNTITLNWTQATDPVSYYLVAFGTKSGNYSYGNPNIGGKGTTSYTISGISGGTTYYFVVRAGNGCAPGPFSNEVAVTPGGGFIEGVPAGFEAGVLGEATKSAELSNGEPTPTTAVINVGIVKGIQSIAKNKFTKYLLPIISLILFVSIAFYFYKKRNS